MMPKDWGLRLATLAALILLAGGGIFAAHRYTREQAEHQILAAQLVRTRHTAAEVEGLLNRLTSGIDKLARSDDLNGSSDDVLRRLELLAVNFPNGLLRGICQQDKDGNILAEYPPDWLQHTGFPAHLLTEVASEHDHAGPRLIRSAPEPAIQLVQRAPGPEGTSQLSALISIPALQRLFAEDLDDSFMFVLDQNGAVVYHPNLALVGADFETLALLSQETEFPTLMLKIARGIAGAGIIPDRLLGEFEPHPADRDLALSYVPLNVSGSTWALALATPAAGLEAISDSHLATLAIFLLGAGGVAFIVYAPCRQLLGTLRAASSQLGFNNEVSELREKLAAAELRNRQLLDNAGDALFFIDPHDGTILDQNRACEKLLGYSRTELAALSLESLLPGAQNRKYLRLTKKVQKNGYGEASELQFRTKSGTSFTGSVHARLGSLGDRQVIHGVIRDVTRLKQIEKELRQRNRELTLINQISFKAAEGSSLKDVLATVRAMVVAAFDADGGGIYLSQNHGRKLDLVTHEGIAGGVLDELKDLPPGAGLIGRVLASGRPISSANLNKDRRLWSQSVRRSGWKVLQSVPLGSREKTIGVLFVFHQKKRVYSRDEVRLLQAIGQQVGIIIANADLLEELTWQNRLTQATNRELQSSRRLLRENLRRQQEATRTLERSEKMKSRFLTLASHELRTPLTYILSGSQLLLEEGSEEPTGPRQKILRAIREGGERLEEIVNNLLEIARIEAQSIYLGQEQIHLELLLEQLRETFGGTLQENQLTLHIDRPLPVVESFQGDRDHLSKALQRLMENAIKFTPPGGCITLSARLLAGEQVLDLKERLQPFREQFFRQTLANDYLQLTVADTGIGIDPDEQLQIFDKFYEVGDIDAHFTSRTRFGGKGIGLGLALVKGIVEAHNGMVWVESAGTGHGGSAFHLLLPLSAAELEELPEPFPDILTAS